MRFNIKDALFQLFKNQNELTVVKAGATCIAAIAVIELPLGMWNDLLQTLQTMSQSHEISERFGCLYTLGFICEDIEPAILSENDLNLMIGALLENVLPAHINVTQISMKAFSRAAHLVDRNFKSDIHRKFIMDKLFEAATIKDEDILLSTMEALNDIAKVCYDYLDQYIEQIGGLTMNLIESNFEGPARLAIEIWSTVAEVEIQRNQ